MNSHSGIIVEIKTRPHPNADRLQLGDAFGNTVVIGKDVQDGDLGIFFEDDLQLSKEFCEANDLCSRYDESGNKVGGYFSENRRVRAQTFRGVKSEGFWIPISSLQFAGGGELIGSLRPGIRIDSFNEVPICNKFLSERTKSLLEKKKNSEKVEKKPKIVFPKHFDTIQFRTNAHVFEKGQAIIITEKLHGTSGRFLFCKEEKENPWWKFWKQKSESRMIHAIGSRNVFLGSIEDRKLKSGYYSNEGFRYSSIKHLEGLLRPNEIIFYEIIGWCAEETPIMPPGNVSRLKDKKLEKTFGSQMFWSYGTAKGECEVYVYRIGTLQENGEVQDLSWWAVKERAKQLGLKTVPEICSIIYDGDLNALQNKVQSLLDGTSMLDQSHLKEGICLRVEGLRPIILKQKSFNFKVLEGLEDAVDIEGAS